MRVQLISVTLEILSLRGSKTCAVTESSFYSYAAELHIVHFNPKYGSVAEAAENDDGIAVLGIFIEEGPEDNLSFETIIHGLPAVHEAGESGVAVVRVAYLSFYNKESINSGTSGIS